MPTYDYTCNACDYEFVSFNRINERKTPTVKPCPECGRESVRLVIRHATAALDPIRMGRVKPPEGFTSVLKRIGSESPGHSMNIRD